jgi:predicted patatin/cPLA2 family phospholipase
MDTPRYDLVLGAGGVKGYAHVGVLRAIQELGLEIGTVTGVSVGAGVAALYTNGYTPEEILNTFAMGRRRMFDPSLWMSAFKMPNPMAWMVSQSCISLEGIWRDQCERYGLKANDRLQILSYDVCRAQPVLFKGTKYDLAMAVAASGSVPGVFSPVQFGGGMLVDGAVYHYNPTAYSREPAIVVRLGRATRWPNEPLTPMDAYYHFREMYVPLIPTVAEVDEDFHIVIDVPCEDVAGLSLGTNERRCLQLVEEGYQAARAALKRAIATGRLKVKEPARI